MDSRCQQFTETDISNEMLDMANYKDNLYGKKVLENSCGEGNILGLIVERYISSALKDKLPLYRIKQGLENDIYGVEIVKKTYNICISNLNKIVFKYGITGVKWNIIQEDVLKKPFTILFDFVIGNPPYISYKNLEQKERKFIKDNFYTCKKGKPDYCYAFIENAINFLKPKGKMVYLIPNSIFKNVFAKELREMILPHLQEIFDFPNCKLFKKALTSSAIIILEKNSNSNQFIYHNVVQNGRVILEKKFLQKKWTFKKQREVEVNEIIRFDNIYKASITIATQRNKIFVMDKETKDKYGVENGAVRIAISPRNQAYNKKEYIIFPYRVRNNTIYRYKEDEYKEKYPNAYKYLKNNKEELDSRDSDKNAKWFEYGRSQAINNTNKKKLLISTVVTNEIKVYKINTKTIPYSGIYIISEKGYDLGFAKNILESNQFLDYIKQIGTPASGSSLRITADDINKFTFKKNDFIYEE